MFIPWCDVIFIPASLSCTEVPAEVFTSDISLSNKATVLSMPSESSRMSTLLLVGVVICCWPSAWRMLALNGDAVMLLLWECECDGVSLGCCEPDDPFDNIPGTKRIHTSSYALKIAGSTYVASSPGPFQVPSVLKSWDGHGGQSYIGLLWRVGITTHTQHGFPP